MELEKLIYNDVINEWFNFMVNVNINLRGCW